MSMSDEWMTIETAPRDGDLVILYTTTQYGVGRRFIARWYPKFSLEVGEDHYGDWGDWHEGSGQYFCPEGWYEQTYYAPDGFICAVCDDPTHWQPLPAPPSKK